MPPKKTTKTTRTVKPRAIVVEPVIIVDSEPLDEVVVATTEREFWVLKTDPNWKDFTGPEYFYDGQIMVKDGVAKVPVANTHWVKRLLFSNYAFMSERDADDFRTATEA